MTKKEQNRQRVLNGGRGGGEAYRRLFEYFENKVANLENKIAELEEANADLKQSLDWADERESEDVKRIEKLEKENAELKKLPESDKKALLEAQIEKMQSCENCAFFKKKKYAICHNIKKFGKRKCAFYEMF